MAYLLSFEPCLKEGNSMQRRVDYFVSLLLNNFRLCAKKHYRDLQPIKIQFERFLCCFVNDQLEDSHLTKKEQSSLGFQHYYVTTLMRTFI